MAHVEGEIVIARPIEEVFDFVADERNEPRYNRRMASAELLTPEPIGRGSRFQAEMRTMGRPIDMMVEFTEFDRPRLLGSRTQSLPRGRRRPAMLTEGSLFFDAVPKGTRLRWSWQVQTPGGMRLAAPLITWMGERRGRGGAVRLMWLLQREASINSIMISVKVSREEPTGLHEPVAAEIRRAIADGEAKPGERLPPAKDLAAVLGVNTNTVLRALRTLRDEGLLEFRRGRGITVTGTPERGAVVARAHDLVAFARAQGYRPDELVRIIEDIA